MLLESEGSLRGFTSCRFGSEASVNPSRRHHLVCWLLFCSPSLFLDLEVIWTWGTSCGGNPDSVQLRTQGHNMAATFSFLLELFIKPDLRSAQLWTLTDTCLWRCVLEGGTERPCSSAQSPGDRTEAANCQQLTISKFNIQKQQSVISILINKLQNRNIF